MGGTIPTRKHLRFNNVSAGSKFTTSLGSCFICLFLNPCNLIKIQIWVNNAFYMVAFLLNTLFWYNITLFSFCISFFFCNKSKYDLKVPFTIINIYYITTLHFFWVYRSSCFILSIQKNISNVWRVYSLSILTNTKNPSYPIYSSNKRNTRDGTKIDRKWTHTSNTNSLLNGYYSSYQIYIPPINRITDEANQRWQLPQKDRLTLKIFRFQLFDDPSSPGADSN